MDISLTEASEEDYEVVENLSTYYIYEMSKECGHLPGWKMPESGRYIMLHLKKYWTEDDRFPFMIRVDDELAGFALIHPHGTTDDIDWTIGEFFITSKFQNRGVGREIAHELFDQLQGNWEVMQMPDNKRAISFWEKVIGKYTDGRFTKEKKTVSYPKPHPMIVMRFQTP